jgi:hypothetical protein
MFLKIGLNLDVSPLISLTKDESNEADLCFEWPKPESLGKA